MRRLAHVVVVALALAAVAVATQTATGGPLTVVAGGVWLVWYATCAILLPRLAHAAFRGGRTAQARRRYRLLALISPAARDGARVSRAGCHLIERNWDRAQRELLAIDGEQLSAVLHAAWLNNRAYAIARGGRADAEDALGLVEVALTTRPGVPGFLHTRGLALLAAGRLDDAIRAFEAVWDAGELDPSLEAERCHDLALAWERKGHHDYAADYRRRAVRADPSSRWARDAQQEHEAHAADLAALEAQIAS